MSSLIITLIGGPTALIEIDGFRLLTDPTFDAPGAYQLPHVKLEKLSGPALGTEALGNIDAVLLSHDQHADNLDHSGKDFLPKARRVLTTVAGAQRLGGHAEGLAPWATIARAFPDAVIIPLHTDGWAHFRQNASDLRASFDTLGFGARLKLLEPGVATLIEMPHALA
jgi:Beta-lactamase superfamily domain